MLRASAGLAPGFDRVYAPGEIEFVTEQAYRRDGIRLASATLADVGLTARRLGVETGGLTWLRAVRGSGQ
jgi:LDH2 family malate/lactate/ureidoglycolate dehydrogenase